MPYEEDWPLLRTGRHAAKRTGNAYPVIRLQRRTLPKPMWTKSR